MRDLERRVRDELRPPDRDAGGDADAVEREADHHSVAAVVATRPAAGRGERYERSPKPSWKSAAISRIAATSSGPSVSSRTVVPTDAVSSITATILRALARRPLTHERDVAAEARGDVDDPGARAGVQAESDW